MNVEEFRKAAYQAIDQICDFHSSLDDRNVIPTVEPGYLRQHIPASLPEKGESFQQIAKDYEDYIVPGLTLWQHPSFFAYFPTGFSFESVLADLYAASSPNPSFNWLASPACTELEVIVMDWAADLLGLSDAFKHTSHVGGGVIQTSASDSVLTVVVAARARYMANHPDAKNEDLLIYTTTQTHSVGAKAGIVFGIPVKSIDVSMEDQLSLKGANLRSSLEDDVAKGKHPIILIATVGTTSTGAVDSISEIQEVARNFPDMWVHVDAAWAGVALCCPEFRPQLELDAINAFAHSFCTNFHKWGLVNFDCSTLWVRDRAHLVDALEITPPFLRTKQGDAGAVVDYRNWHLGLGRRFRSLKMWFVLRGYGVEGFQKYIRQGVGLNKIFAGLLQKTENFTIVTKPSLSLTVFRFAPSSWKDRPVEDFNKLTQDLFSRLSSRHDIMLTTTTLNGVVCIRFAVGSARTKEEHIKGALEIIKAEADATLQAWEQKDSNPKSA